MIRRGRLACATAVLVAMFTAWGGPVVAQDYPPGDATCTVTDASGDGVFAPGESGVVTCENLTANESYELDFEQSPGVILATAGSDANGDVTFNFTVPTTADDGRATLTTQPVDDTGRVATVSITVRSAQDVADEKDDRNGDVNLPTTGSPIDRYVGTGIILVLAGLGLVALTWWRRRSARPSF